MLKTRIPVNAQVTRYEIAKCGRSSICSVSFVVWFKRSEGAYIPCNINVGPSIAMVQG